jgi:hypothetical protein
VIDCIFPPLCLSCREKSKYKFLCADCWKLCELPDPIEKCRHCFHELDDKGNLCRECRKEKKLPIVRAYVFDPESPAHHLGFEAVDAMAGFAILQWVALEWPTPQAVIALPDKHSMKIGKSFAKMLDVPFIKALRSNLDYVEDRLEEDLELLLFDGSNCLEDLQKACLSILESFPKKVYLLSLCPYADFSPASTSDSRDYV